MKKIIYFLLLFIPLIVSSCFTETPEYVTVVPEEEIQDKLKELRDLQRELDDENVNIVDLQAKIDDLITQINNLVAPGNVPITYSIGILSAAYDDLVAVSGATVTIDIRGERQTSTTDSDGQAVFQDLRSGIVTVYVEVNGYTDVSFVADLLVDDGAADDYQTTGEDFNVTSAIALYPTTAANGATVVNGTLYYDPDRTDDILDPLDPNYGNVPYYNSNTSAANDVYQFRPASTINLQDGVFVSETKGTLDARIQSWQMLTQPIDIFVFMKANTLDYGFIPVGTAGNIVLAIYDEMFVRTTSNNGTFQLVRPSGYNGNTYEMHVEEFKGDEDYIRASDYNTGTMTTTLTTRTREVIFTPMYFDINGSWGFPGSYNGGLGYYDFILSNVNNINSSAGSRYTITSDIYFGAKTLDE